MEAFEEEDTIWLGQDGGCEGLRQKGWTTVTIAAFKVAEHRTGITSKIIGQGDNQVLLLNLPKKENIEREGYIRTYHNHIEEQITGYMQVLANIMKGLGMEIKIQESWVSLYHLNYGKELVINGAFTSSVLKKISRSYQEVSDAIPTIDNRASAIFSACQTATMKGFDPVVPYYIATVETLQLIDHEYQYGTILKNSVKKIFKSENMDLSQEVKLFLLILPKDFGGYQTINFLEYLFRGHPDPLTGQLLWLKICARFIEIATGIQEYILSRDGIRNEIDFRMLVQDPLSINWDIMGSTSTVMKTVLVDALKKVTKNKVVNKMFETYNEDTLTELISYLSKIEPCSPRVLGEIFRLSPEGAKWSFLSTFTDMRTMKNMLSDNDAFGMYKDIIRAEERKLSHLLSIYKKIKAMIFKKKLLENNIQMTANEVVERDFTCTTTLATTIRNESWKREIVGVTTPHPYEQFSLHHCIGNECPLDIENEDRISYSLVHSDRSTYLQESAVMRRGPNRPYWGSGTSEKKSTPLVQMPKTDRSIKAVQQLSRIRDWVCSEEGTLRQLVDNLIESRTELDRQMVALIAGTTYGGSQYHRFTDVMKKKEGRPSIRANLSTCIYFSTDLLGKYSKGLDNYYIFFQGVILLAMTRMSICVFFNQEKFEDRPIVFHQHPVCDGCLEKIEEPLLEVFDKPPLVRSAVGCPLIYSTIDSAGAIANWSKTADVNLKTPLSASDYNQRSVCSALALIVIAEGTSKHSPIVQGLSKIKAEESFVSSLTVGLFQKISLSVLFDTLTKTWLADIIPTIVEISDSKGTDIYQELNNMITSYPDITWSIITPFLSLPNIREQLVATYNHLIHSSEFFKDFRGLGSLMIKIIRDSLETIYTTNSTIRLPLYFRTNHFHLDRSLAMYLNACILEGYKDSELITKRLINIVKSQINLSVNDSVDTLISKMFFQYCILRTKYPKLPDIKWF